MNKSTNSQYIVNCTHNLDVHCNIIILLKITTYNPESAHTCVLHWEIFYYLVVALWVILIFHEKDFVNTGIKKIQ